MNRTSIALAVLFLAVSPLLAADAPNTVRIGKELKKTVGIVRSFDAGDVACYVTLDDERGQSFTELAAFEICEQKPSLIGKRVRLKYSIESVIDDECQGDPECTKSKKVAVISEARIEAKPAPAKSAAQTSFCTAAESVVFACRTGTKLVSVCASKEKVSYRFGKADSREPLELALTAPISAIRGENVPFAGGGGSWLRFPNGAHSYVVYSGSGKWGPKGETKEKQGLVVENRGKTVAILPCSGRATSVLGPEWFVRSGVKSRGEDFTFPK